MTRTITGKTKAWLPEYKGPGDISGDPDSAVASLVFHTPFDGDGASWKAHGYVYVGEAEITVTIPDEKGLVEEKVESLKAAKKKVLAEAQAKATELETQIQKLLAITYEG